MKKIKLKKDDIMKDKAYYVEDDVMANNQIHKRTITLDKKLNKKNALAYHRAEITKLLEFIKFHKRCIRDLQDSSN